MDKINDYLIVDPPTSGKLVAIDNDMTLQASSAQDQVLPAVTIFSLEDLDRQKIQVGEGSQPNFCSSKRFHAAFLSGQTGPILGK